VTVGISASLRQAWPAFWVLRKQRPEPAWARLLIAAALGFASSFALVMLAGLLRLGWFDPAWWHSVAVPLVSVGVAVGLTLLGVFRTLELALPEAALARLHTEASWRSSLILNALAATGILLGCAIGMLLVYAFYDASAWDGLALARQRRHFALFMLVLIGGNVILSSVRARQLEKRRRATETQLQLLQAQIEPQFLFNTLAEVQGLLDHDPERARQMLEEFTDYLRASLGQLRRADSTLAAELEMAQCYLQLLHLSMGERLHFAIDADQQVRTAVLPPLLLQPLVENAIRHGLGPRAEGGSIQIRARQRFGRLDISVIDDGIGLPEVAPGTGQALGNIRARLKARYGSNASLTLAVQAEGMRATLELPFIGAAVDSSHKV
jgi:two-component sensor histidine kinase